MIQIIRFIVKDLIIFYKNKALKKFKRLKSQLFSYPIHKYDSRYQNRYWQVRKKSNSKAKPNNFQVKRAKIFSGNILHIDKTLFDIGSGDGSQLIAIKNICKTLRIIGSDMDNYACKISIENNINCHFLKNEEEVFDLIKKYNPNYISLFEVLEHMKNPEDFLLKLLEIKDIKVFFSIPNSGFIKHRIRFLFGRFPLQWIAHPSEHLRFWTIKDLKWWLVFLNIYSKSKVIPYNGIPLLNQIFPNLFAEGSFVIINQDNK